MEAGIASKIPHNYHPVDPSNFGYEKFRWLKIWDFAKKRSMHCKNWQSNTKNNFWINGMSISVRKKGCIDERVEAVYFTRSSLIVDLRDGRSISVPLTWYPKLLKATPQKRAHWEVCGGGYGIHWPEIDEDLSVEGLLRGAPACKFNQNDCIKREHILWGGEFFHFDLRESSRGSSIKKEAVLIILPSF